MNAVTNVCWLHALTPLHVGSGRGVGFVDLPVMREKATGWPVVPGSTVKGIMRGHFEARNQGASEAASGDEGAQRAADDAKRLLELAFGRAGDDAGNAGALAYTDARLVLFPVRSLYGTFAWVTSPLALQWLTRDLKGAGIPGVPGEVLVDGNLVAVTGSSVLPGPDGKIYLEDLDLEAARGDAGQQASAWAEFLGGDLFAEEPGWRARLAQRLAVVPDDIFSILAETGTEIVARVRISDTTKTVESGALWYEENLPAETVLAGLVWCDRVYGRNGVTPADLMEKFCHRPVRCQMGGKTTVGRGLVRCLFRGRGA